MEHQIIENDENTKIIQTMTSPIPQLSLKLNHLKNQNEELSKGDNKVTDYDGIPLRNKTKNKLKQAIIYTPIPIKENFTNNSLKDIITLIIIAIILYLLFFWCRFR
jgi:hypothetical protein